MRTGAAAIAICLASWLGLATGAGNIGLQRSVAVSPMTFLEVPLALALAAGAALLIGALAGRNGVAPLPLLGAVLVGDLIGAAVLAPLAVGELEIMHAPTVFAAITALGMQPIGAVLGSWLARRA
jgi:hypothetical protein